MEGLESIAQKYPNKILNVRGRGLMCAFDLLTPNKRDELQKKLYSKGLIVIGCGSTTIRFRPPLIISSKEIDQSLEIIDKTLSSF